MTSRNWITILTAMFMHAGWAHILGNIRFFWVLGSEIEDVMGPLRYLAFYLLGVLAQVQSGSVAYTAHIGGFDFGALTARAFESRRSRLQQGLK